MRFIKIVKKKTALYRTELWLHRQGFWSKGRVEFIAKREFGKLSPEEKEANLVAYSTSRDKQLTRASKGPLRLNATKTGQLYLIGDTDEAESPTFEQHSSPNGNEVTTSAATSFLEARDDPNADVEQYGAFPSSTPYYSGHKRTERRCSGTSLARRCTGQAMAAR